MAAKILIADDDDEFRNMLASTLTKHGYEVSTANNGGAGQFLSHLDNFDIILTDICMPKLDGIELLKYLKKEANTPVILMTGFADAKTKNSATLNAADGFLEKPFTVNALLELIAKVLGNKHLQ